MLAIRLSQGAIYVSDSPASFFNEAEGEELSRMIPSSKGLARAQAKLLPSEESGKGMTWREKEGKRRRFLRLRDEGLASGVRWRDALVWEGRRPATVWGL